MKDNLEFVDVCSKRHDLFICARWLFRMRSFKDNLHFADVLATWFINVCVTWLICTWSFNVLCSHVWNDSIVCDLLRIICTSHTCVATRLSQICLTCLIRMWPFKDSLLTCVTWLIRIWPFKDNLRLTNVIRETKLARDRCIEAKVDEYVTVTWVCDMTDLMCVAWLVFMCDMTQSCVRERCIEAKVDEFVTVTWLCDMLHLMCVSVRQESFNVCVCVCVCVCVYVYIWMHVGLYMYVSRGHKESVLQCIAVHCSVLQCIAVRRSVL